MAKPSKTLIALVAGVIIGASLTAGTVAVEVGASGTSTTSPSWYGCLSTAGALSKVGTVAPTCSGSKTPISWNSYPASGNGTPQCTGFPHIGVDFSGCDLRGAVLQGADLSNSNLAMTNLTKSNLVGVNVAGANLSGVNLTNAYLSKISSGGIIGVPSSVPTGWSVISGFLVGPSANLAGANLAGAHLAGVALGGGATVCPPPGFVCFGGGADLSNSNLSGADLSGANLGGLPSGVSGSASASANLTGANLTSVDFTGISLRGISLTGVNLTQTKLAGALLGQTSSGGITGVPANLPPTWILVRGYLVGPGASFSNVDFTGADLRGSTLAGSSFFFSNLTGANLSGVSFVGAQSMGITWSNTICPDGTNSSAYTPQTCVGHGI